MTLIIDSVTPNQDCVDTPPTDHRRDTCVVEATFHLRRGEGASVTVEAGPEPLSFEREAADEGPNYYVSSYSLNPTLSGLITEHRFDPTQAALVRDIRNIVRIRLDYARGRNIFVEYDRREGAQVTQLFDDIINYLFLGEIVSPDSAQDAINRSLFTRLAALPSEVLENFRITAGSFLLDNREWLQRADDTALPRVERLAFIWNFCRRVREGLAGLPADSPLQGRLLTAQSNVIGHIFGGEPSLSDLRTELSSLANDLYVETPPASGSEESPPRWNLYQILLPALEALGENPPFNASGEPQTRLQRLTRLLDQPSQTRTLEYSILDSREAVERSILDSLSEESVLEEIVEGVEDEIQAPDLSADWLGENGRLHEILEALLASVRVQGSPPRLILDPAQTRTHLQELFGEHSIQTREYVAGSLAVLRYLTGRESLQVYWDGQMRTITWNLSDEDRRSLRSVDHWLTSQIESSLQETDLVLPIIEGAVCAIGAGLLTWGLVDRPRADSFSPLVLTGGGVSGLGCGAFAAHWFIDTRNPYISDAIGGGIGTLLGIGIPLLVYLLGGAFNSGPMPPPLDGRNPVDGWGP